MVDARLPDGSRVNAVLPPLALDGPLLTIRRFPEQPFGVATWSAAAASRPSRPALLGAACAGG